MNKLISSIIIAATLATSAELKAAVNIGHVENPTVGEFLSSTGSALTAGGVSIGFFTSAVANSAFGTTITNYSSMLSAGWVDVRSLASSFSSGFDWDFPQPVGGTANAIGIGALPQNTQLYVVAFNNGTLANGFAGFTQWAVVKDDAHLSPADLGTKILLLNTTTAPEVLIGTDNGNNVNMAIPEPSRVILLGLGALGVFFRRRR